MRDEILKKIGELSDIHHVKILFACESGSRAWGFPSPDSDYDVRFIYAGTLPDYLDLHDKKDTIDVPVNPILDVNGWDLRKSLKLFTKSNGPLYEWLQSPIVYSEIPGFRTELTGLMPRYFSPVAGFHHYFSMARNVIENDLSGDVVKLKKYFYALRPLLACRWIIDKNAVPPMEFSVLRSLISNDRLKEQLEPLLELKAISNEAVVIEPILELNEWISESIAYCSENASSLRAVQYDIAPLNALFIKYIS